MALFFQHYSQGFNLYNKKLKSLGGEKEEIISISKGYYYILKNSG